MKINSIKLLSVIVLIPLFLISCGIIGAGTHGNIKRYKFNLNKMELDIAIKKALAGSPQYKVPDVYYDCTWHYGGDSTIKDAWIQEANADSVSFNFYLPNRGIVVWCALEGHSQDWYIQPCTLALIGYINPNQGKWKFENDLNKDDKRQITKEFEELILDKITSASLRQ